MDFKKIDKKYKPIPFWSWNERLECDETRRQVAVMDEAGIGGYFMHARGGLLTEYMESEWFDNIAAAADEGNKRGMYPWAYDENGWPSGFGGGKVNGLGEEYWQKMLTIEPLTEENASSPRTVAIKNGYRYYYDVNEFYVDTMSEKVVARFIKEIYEEYYDKCGDSICGFFTDEPQIMRTGCYPWSLPMVEKFERVYGYSLIDRINELFFDEGSYEETRVDFWKLATESFSKNYFKQIYDWCTAHGYGFTGHLLLEENLLHAMRSSGASMPHYEYFSVPGMDWLGRPIYDCLTAAALGSAAAQLGKKQVLSETFALSGHGVTLNDLKRIYEWQMVRGINLLCPHLEGYSLRGIRKRDYPPAMYYQQPWWDDAEIFFDSLSRIGMLLTEGKISADTLVIINQTTAWKLYCGMNAPGSNDAKKKIDYYNKRLLDVMRELERRHVLYHLGDEILMERHGKVEGGKLVIGDMSYSRVIVSENLGLLPNTEKLLSEFTESGGKIVTVDEIEPNPITEPGVLTYTKRTFPDFDMHYFVNSTDTVVSATFAHGNKRLDVQTGELYDFFGSHTFASGESLVLIDTHEPRGRAHSFGGAEQLSLCGEWRVKDASYNSLTLDRCDYYFDGELIAKGGYVLDILPRINELRREVELKQVYTFVSHTAPTQIYLCTETPEIFDITLNGAHVSTEVKGTFRDKSFKLLDIASQIKSGVNELVLVSRIKQTDKTYDHLSKSWAFETMKNSLSYDMEIEPIYIVGGFGVKIPEKSEDSYIAYRIDTCPEIIAAPTTVKAEALDDSGYPELAGKLVLEREIELEKKPLFVALKGRGISAVHLKINGKDVAARLFAPYNVDISDYIVSGKNTFELTVLTNLRNMQGPYHHTEMDLRHVSPASFYRESNVFNHPWDKGEDCHDILSHFDDRYSLIHFGVTD